MLIKNKNLNRQSKNKDFVIQKFEKGVKHLGDKKEFQSIIIINGNVYDTILIIILQWMT